MHTIVSYRLIALFYQLFPSLQRREVVFFVSSYSRMVIIDISARFKDAALITRWPLKENSAYLKVNESTCAFLLIVGLKTLPYFKFSNDFVFSNKNFQILACSRVSLVFIQS